MSEIERRRSPSGSTLEARMDYWTDVEGHCWIWKGSTDPNGYGRIKVDGRREFVHRVAYSLFTGEPIPEGFYVNHLCGVRGCARPQHLSLTSPAENAQFLTALSKHNTSGYRGVSYRAAGNKWEAKVVAYGVEHYLGRYDTAEEAAAVAAEARRELHGVPDFAEVIERLFT